MRDKIGILTSTLCLVHCLVFPFLFSILPALKVIDGGFEWILIFIAFVVGSLSFYDNAKKHGYMNPLYLFSLGFLCILISKIFNEESSNIGGLVCLIIAHWLNYSYIKKKDGCHPHNCKHNH